MPVLDYEDRTSYRREVRAKQFRELLRSPASAALTAFVFTAFGLFTRSGKSGSEWAILPVVLCGAWYILLRVASSRLPGGVKSLKACLGIASLLLSPFLLCPRPAQPSILHDLLNYPRYHRFVLPHHWTLFAAVMVLLTAFLVVDIVGAVHRRRRRHPRYPAA